MIKIASCQYQIEKLADWKSYTIKIESIVTQAKQAGAQLLLLPEYAGVEIVCARFDTEHGLFEAIQPNIKKYIEFYQDLARRHQLYIQSGTIIENTSQGKYVNRAYLFAPNGTIGYQDKLQLTEYEKSIKILQNGEQQNLFETTLGKIGIAICYDSEFPEIVQRLVHAGASLILVPSYTSTLAGYNRVFLSSRARAIENQCYVAVSFVVNTVDLSETAENTFGRAAILGPADTGFPDDGIIAQGVMNNVMLVTAAISFEKMTEIRKQGQVHNFEDSKRCALINEQKINQVRL